MNFRPEKTQFELATNKDGFGPKNQKQDPPPRQRRKICLGQFHAFILL